MPFHDVQEAHVDTEFQPFKFMINKLIETFKRYSRGIVRRERERERGTHGLVSQTYRFVPCAVLSPREGATTPLVSLTGPLTCSQPLTLTPSSCRSSNLAPLVILYTNPISYSNLYLLLTLICWLFHQ